MKKINIELLDNALAWAEMESKKPNCGNWDQKEWAIGEVDAEGEFCGTSFCIAGRVLHESGYGFVVDEGGRATLAVTPDGERVRIPEEAAALLGLTGDDAYELFFSDNDLPTLFEIRDRFAARAAS